MSLTYSNLKKAIKIISPQKSCQMVWKTSTTVWERSSIWELAWNELQLCLWLYWCSNCSLYLSLCLSVCLSLSISTFLSFLSVLMAYDRSFPCVEATYPSAIKNQRGATLWLLNSEHEEPASPVVVVTDICVRWSSCMAVWWSGNAHTREKYACRILL